MKRTASLQWQLVVPRLLGEDGYLDQPNIGFCSPPTVEGNRAYVVTNRSEVVCLDLNGQSDGNDGPYSGRRPAHGPAGRKSRWRSQRRMRTSSGCTI